MAGPRPSPTCGQASPTAGSSPTFGRPSPASDGPWKLTARTAETAAVRADGADTSWCALRVATVVGVRHRLAGSAVEDAWAWAGGDDVVAVAVADGVGGLPASAPVASTVATVAVDAAIGRSVDGLAAADGPDAADGLAAAVGAANDTVAGVEDGASTLVVALVHGDGSVEVIRVGDSTAFRLSGDAWSEVFVDADGDEMRLPATAALPSLRPEVERARLRLDPGDALVLVTDGIGDPLRDGPSTVGPGLATGLEGPPSPLALAALVDFSRQGCHDDRTLLAVWWHGAGAGATGGMTGG